MNTNKITLVKHFIKTCILRKPFELLGIDRFSRPSLRNLDSKLEDYLNFDNGVFLEIGANDGFTQSNTYYLEKFRKWEGVLIEPIPKLYKKCKRERKNSEVFNYICSNHENSGKYKSIRYAGLMSQVSGTLKDQKDENYHIEDGVALQNLKQSYSIDIKCLTLSEVIDKSSYSKFDLISIDVEGHELSVLQGLDLERHAPTFLLVEVWDENKKIINKYLEKKYVVIDKLTERDILYKLL